MADLPAPVTVADAYLRAILEEIRAMRADLAKAQQPTPAAKRAPARKPAAKKTATAKKPTVRKKSK